METSFQELKKREVVNLLDGKRLGKVCNVLFTFPEGRTLGIVVPGCRGFRWSKSDLFIELRQIKKIGIDVILVELNCAPPSDKKKDRGENYPPQNCPPPCPPHNPPCPPPRQQNCPPQQHYQPQYYDRRDYGEYE